MSLARHRLAPSAASGGSFALSAQSELYQALSHHLVCAGVAEVFCQDSIAEVAEVLRKIGIALFVPKTVRARFHPKSLAHFVDGGAGLAELLRQVGGRMLVRVLPKKLSVRFGATRFHSCAGFVRCVKTTWNPAVCDLIKLGGEVAVLHRFQQLCEMLSDFDEVYAFARMGYPLAQAKDQQLVAVLEVSV